MSCLQLEVRSDSAALLRLLHWPVFSQRLRRRHLPLLLLLAAFLVVEFTYPRFPDSDSEISRKAAGLHLSQGGAFAAPELEGFLHVDPPIERIYFVYPPLYTWLFGQWTRVTGFGWAACVGYDALISAVLALIVYGLTGAVAGELLGPLSVLRRNAVAIVPAFLTLLFRQAARTDELAMVLGFANAWWLFLPRGSPRWPLVSFVSGALAGLMLCTSAGVFLTFMPFLVALWLLRQETVREIVHSLAAAALGAGLVAAICLPPFFRADPHFYHQSLQHLDSEIYGWGIASMLRGAWEVSRQRVFLLCATLPVFCLGMITLWRTGRIRETLALYVAPLVGFGLVVFLRQWATYWWFLQPWFLLVAVIVAADFWWSRASRLVATIVVSWLVTGVVAASAWPVKDYLVRMTLPPEQSLATNVQKLRELIPKGAGVLTSNGWWALGNDHLVYHPAHSDIQDLSRIEYFVADSNGSGEPGVWVPPANPRYDAMVRESFEVISDSLPKEPLQIFGFRITNSAYGFGSIVLRRMQAESPPVSPPAKRASSTP
jgi:hypothetical protein